MQSISLRQKYQSQESSPGIPKILSKNFEDHKRISSERRRVVYHVNYFPKNFKTEQNNGRLADEMQIASRPVCVDHPVQSGNTYLGG